MLSIKLKRQILVSLMLATASLAGANAGVLPVLGLSLCGKVSEKELRDNIEKNGGSGGELQMDERMKNSFIEATGYMIGEKPRRVELNLFKGKLFYIFIDDANGLEELLAAKYGKAIKLERGEIAGIPNWKTRYNSGDSDVSITHTNVGSQPPFISYTCKSIERERRAEMERSERQKALAKPGASKL